MDYFTGLLILGGAVLHFLGSWGEAWKTSGRIGPVKFISLDLPKWVSAAVGAAISYAVLPQLGPIIGVGPPLGAVAAGYAATSLSAKLPTLGHKRG